MLTLQKKTSLPWVWMAENLRTKHQVKSFETWWAWRIQGEPPWGKQQSCPLCEGSADSTTHHIKDECPEAARRTEGKAVTTMDFLDLPNKPEKLMAQVLLAEDFNTTWRKKRDDGKYRGKNR